MAMVLPQRIFAICFLAALLSAPSRAQMPEGPQSRLAALSAEYDNSAEGLRLQLRAILKVAKDPEKLKPLITELEMPDYEGWFEKNFDASVQRFWAGSYRRALRSEDSFAAIFVILGQRDGDFKIRKVNGAPTTHLEEVFTDKMKNPVDVFAASWKRRNAPENSGEQLLGYYFFLDSKFRWFYMLGFPKNQGAAPANGGTSKGESNVPPASKSSTTPPSSQPK